MPGASPGNAAQPDASQTDATTGALEPYLSTLSGAPLGLNIVNAVIVPDGYPRSAVLVNGQFPGPVITGTKGQNFSITVNNLLTDPSMATVTSVHWHGIFQHDTPTSDGTSGVTQCPLVPGASYTQQFAIDDQAGTFWYHSHYSTQYCDGLRGVFVMYEREGENPWEGWYDVDDESTIITLADWYHKPSPEMLFPNQDSTLINGKGRYPGGRPTDLSVVPVQPGKRYRFRLVSMSCLPNYLFSIDGHNFTVIEADGVDHQPVTVDSVKVFAGQRYSIILEANQDVDNYWIRARPDVGNHSFHGGLNSAILRYEGAPDEEPQTQATGRGKELKETDLHPLQDPGAPGEPYEGGVDIALNIVFNFDDERQVFTMNGVNYVSPTVPVLMQIMSHARSPQELLPSGSVYEFPPNKTIEVSIPGGGPVHPMHLHGHAFDVVRSANSTEYNYANPVRRDVVNIGTTGDNVTFRFRTDNPGPWFLHCHVDWHLATGFAVVFAEEVDEIASEDARPAAWDDLCPAYERFNKPSYDANDANRRGVFN